MKSILRNTAIGLMSLGLTATVLPAQDVHQDNRGGQYVQTASRHDDGHYDNRDSRGPYGYSRTYDWGHDDRAYDPDHHGRDAAIVIGSAAGGALIGATAAHGEGAVVGAIVGGVGGLLADEAIRHHEYRR